MSEPAQQTAGGDPDLREKALSRVKQKRDFKGHLLSFAGVNGFLVVIWAVTGAGFFWPMFPIIGWGLFGIAPHAWSVYGRHEISEDEIQREMDRLR